MRRNIFALIVFAFSFFTSLTALASREVGNGGIGFYCPNETDPAKRVLLLDLFEGSALLKLTPLDRQLTYEAYALSFARQLDAVLRPEISFTERITGIINTIHFIKSNLALTDTDDADNFIYPKDCVKVQILNNRGALVLVNSNYWNLLTDTGKAAAILHEAIYAYVREKSEASELTQGEVTSARTRQIVAMLMAGRTLYEVDDSAEQNPISEVLSCSTLEARFAGRATTDFMVYYDGRTTHITFTRLGGRVMLTRGTIDFMGSLEGRGVESNVTSLIDWNIRAELSRLSATDQLTIYLAEGDNRSLETASCNRIISHKN